MRLASFRHQGRTSFGVVEGDEVVDCGAAQPGLGLADVLIENPILSVASAGSNRSIPLSEIEFLPPIPEPPRIFCVGRNFKGAMREAGLDFPAHPILFMRTPASLVGHGAPIVRPSASEQFDYEGEVAVIVGRPGRHLSLDDALDHIAGYMCFNDGSVRDWQRHTSQDTPGKNFWRSGSAGPWLVTADEIPDPRALVITTRVNDEVVQQGTLDDLLFDIPDVIAYLSRIAPLQSGDIVALGTPFGAGINRKPPRWLVPGDEVAIAVDGIGTLMNRVVDEQDALGAPAAA